VLTAKCLTKCSSTANVCHSLYEVLLLHLRQSNKRQLQIAIHELYNLLMKIKVLHNFCSFCKYITTRNTMLHLCIYTHSLTHGLCSCSGCTDAIVNATQNPSAIPANIPSILCDQTPVHTSCFTCLTATNLH